MGAYPSAALESLAINERNKRDPIADAGKMVALKGLLANQQQQEQMRPLQLQEAQNVAQQQQMSLQEAQQRQRDDQVGRDALLKSAGDPGAYLKGLQEGGVSPKLYNDAQKSIADYQDKQQQKQKLVLENEARTFDHVLALGTSTKQLMQSQDPADKQQAAQAWDSAVSVMEQSGLVKPGAVAHQLPADPMHVDAALSIAGMQSAITKEALDRANIAAKNKEKEPNKDDRAIAIQGKPEAEWTKEDKAFMNGYHAYVRENKVDPRVAGYTVLAGLRPYPVVGEGGNAVYETGTTIASAAKGGKPLGVGALSPTVQGNIAAGKESVKGVPVIQTALHHLDQLDAAASALDTGNVAFLNQIANAYGVQVGNEPLATYRGIQQIIKGDILAASSAAGAKNEYEEKAIDSVINPDNPVKAIRAASGSVRKLMTDRLKAKGDVFKNATQGGDIFAPQQPITGKIRAKDAKGKLHEAPIGTPLPAGWTLEK